MIHPLPAALADLERLATAVISPDTVPPPTMGRDAATRWVAMRRAILDARPGVIIGALEGDGPDVLSSWNLASLGRAGELYVLDAMAARVVVFDSVGGVTTWFGRVGDGPMELRDPTDFVVAQDSILILHDGGIKVFERGSSGYELQATLDLDADLVLASSFCRAGASIFLNADGSAATIRALRPGEAPNRFGQGYEYGSADARNALSRGSVGCMDGVVVYGSQYLPALYGYTPSGELVWSAILSDHLQGYLLQHPNAIRFPTPPRDALKSIEKGPDRYVLLAYSRRYDQTRTITRTYLVDAATGEGALLEQSERRQDILAVHGTRLVRWLPGEYPRLRIWHMDPTTLPMPGP
ncbi:MAG: hypothetical protein F4164_12375 [Gemmatimonadales bacterium]|nr:hypothetical protein [Gemmatimonadales bacterium]MYG50128.1 hypothetical protein [Gemmatimonadales bacterium]MYK02485.1 hypothetical protein [Candidatus Palauibacter ramosifaciens]